MNTERAIASESVSISVQELVNSFYQDVYRFAYRLSGNQADAEDLTQQTFLTACRKLNQLRDLSKSRQWLFTIVRNAFLKTQRHQEAVLSSFEEQTVAIDVQDDFSLDFDEEALVIALNELPEAYKTPILLYYFEETGYKEIAEILEVPIGTVMSRLSRGKQHLRERLSPDTTSLNSTQDAAE